MTVGGRCLVRTTVILLCCTIVWPPPLGAERPHVVTSEQVATLLASTQRARSGRVRAIQEVLSTPEAWKQARVLNVDIRRLRQVVPTLSDKELEDISRRVQRLEQDPQAGLSESSKKGWTIVLLAVITVGLLVVMLTWVPESPCPDGSGYVCVPG